MRFLAIRHPSHTARTSRRLPLRPAAANLSMLADRPLSDRPFRRSGGDPEAIGDRPFFTPHPSLSPRGEGRGARVRGREIRCDDGDHVATFAETPAIVRHAGTRRLMTDAAPRRGSRHPTFVGSRRGSRTMRPSASRPWSGQCDRRTAGRQCHTPRGVRCVRAVARRTPPSCLNS